MRAKEFTVKERQEQVDEILPVIAAGAGALARGAIGAAKMAAPAVKAVGQGVANLAQKGAQAVGNVAGNAVDAVKNLAGQAGAGATSGGPATSGAPVAPKGPPTPAQKQQAAAMAAQQPPGSPQAAAAQQTQQQDPAQQKQQLDTVASIEKALADLKQRMGPA